ncbi:MAG: GNAT family N-acetyltransferase [Lachnospiraceae bacterium]|nr:GNAT family N-acetyltransferase [Lachnospiraceae bacterium]
MIQRAHLIADREEVIRLWQQCFDDERHYVEFFLQNCPAENALFLYREEKKIAGMMFLMPGRLVAFDGDLDIKTYYLYALCVDEEYRGKGIAKEMLDFAKVYARKDNAELCLVPSSSKLRKYYAQRGFMDVFVRTEQEISVDPSKKFVGGIKKTDINIETLIKARNEAYGSNAFLWNADNLEFAIKENRYSDGFAWNIASDSEATDKTDVSALGDTTPYIIGDIDGKVLQIRETNLKLSVVYRIAVEYNCDRVRFLNIKEPFEEYPFHTVPYAMMANTAQVEKIVKNIRFDKKYINFCFD